MPSVLGAETQHMDVEAASSLLTVTRLFRQNNMVAQVGTDIVDAVIEKVSSANGAKSAILSGGKYLPTNTKPFEVEDGIYAQVIELKLFVATNEPEAITLELFSTTKTLNELKLWVDLVYAGYSSQLNQQLGKHIYFFDMTQHKDELQPKFDANGQTCIRQHHPHVIFERKQFVTTRTFDNIFFPGKDRLLRRLDFFMNKRSWYLDKGIAHSLGMLFSGAPGTGKSSSIKAIANLTKRHIFNIPLKQVRTKTQLKNLLFDDRIFVAKPDEPNSREILTIPISKRLYVFEDVDAVNDLDFLLDRDLKEATAQASKSTKPMGRSSRTKSSTAVEDLNSISTPLGLQSDDGGLTVIDDPSEKIDLSTFLNLLDGVLEADGRLMIFTSNFPQKLDKALLRQGRIDVHVQFALANLQVVKDMFVSFFDIKFGEGHCRAFKTDTISPASIASILFQYFDDPDVAADEIVKVSQK